jgi:hypothetical protein
VKRSALGSIIRQGERRSLHEFTTQGGRKNKDFPGVKSASYRSHLQRAFRRHAPGAEDRRLGEVMKLRRDQCGGERQNTGVNVHVSMDENRKRVERGSLKKKGSLL